MPDISHLIDLSDSGSWASVLPFCVNIQILNQAGGDLPDGDAAPVSGLVPFHNKDNTDEPA